MSKTLIFIGSVNIIHGLIHLIQFLQSALLFSYSLNGNQENWIHELMENPYMGLVWAILGIVTVVIGYRDYKHHTKHCKK
jgi:hypothetical protein